jgi:hypothetical protein
MLFPLRISAKMDRPAQNVFVAVQPGSSARMLVVVHAGFDGCSICRPLASS